jgi:hypothetical protein
MHFLMNHVMFSVLQNLLHLIQIIRCNLNLRDLNSSMRQWRLEVSLIDWH